MARRGKKQHPSPTNARRWYYDACALKKDPKIHAQIINDNPKQNIMSVTSHLALGEALGNVLFKKKEQVDAFTGLIQSYCEAGLLVVKDNDSIEEHLLKIKEHRFEMNFSDSVHLATALKNGCEQLHTSDGDFDYEPAKYRALGAEFGLSNFCIKKV